MDKVKVTWNGDEVKELRFHETGEDGDYLWIEAVLKSGDVRQTYYFKGVC